MRRLAIVLAGLALAGCAAPPPGCSDGVLTRLYLGRGSPQGEVPQAQWEAFVADTVTAHFPAGFTVLDARGQWRGENGGIGREATQVVEIVHDDGAAARADIAAVAEAYRRRFEQEAVLVADSAVRRCWVRAPAR